MDLFTAWLCALLQRDQPESLVQRGMWFYGIVTGAMVLVGEWQPK